MVVVVVAAAIGFAVGRASNEPPVPAYGQYPAKQPRCSAAEDAIA